MGNVVGIAIVWFIIEMLLWYLVAQFMSGWYVFFWFIVAAVIGIILLKKGTTSLKPMATQMQGMGMLNPAMRPPETKITQAVALSIAGILFLIPGILSDIIGVLALLPPVQKKATEFGKAYAMKNQDKLMQMMASRMGGLSGMSGMNPNMMGGLGGLGGGFSNAGGQNPFADMMSGFGNSTANKGTKGKFNQTIDGQAKRIQRKPANDDWFLPLLRS